MSKPVSTPIDAPRRKVSDADIASMILTLADQRGPDGSIAPADAARALAPTDFRALLSRVRRSAVHLAQEGRLQILRKGKPVDPGTFKGVYRLRIVDSRPEAGGNTG